MFTSLRPLSTMCQPNICFLSIASSDFYGIHNVKSHLNAIINYTCLYNKDCAFEVWRGCCKMQCDLHQVFGMGQEMPWEMTAANELSSKVSLHLSNKFWCGLWQKADCRFSFQCWWNFWHPSSVPWYEGPFTKREGQSLVGGQNRMVTLGSSFPSEWRKCRPNESF